MPVYDMPLYRPPSEGANLIIQATLGCSFNGCTFCSMYKAKTYRARPLEEVFTDIDAAARDWPGAHRVFLADGDALGLPADHLRRILDRLASALPNLARVSCYATPINLLRKTPAELADLRARRLTLLYVGIESGDAGALRRVRKGTTPKAMVQGLEKAAAGGMKVSATVVLGLGGRARWREHVEGTAALVNRVPPAYLSTLQLGLEDVAVGRFHEKYGEPFHWQDDDGILAELGHLVALLDPPRPVIFRSNHASNALALAGTLPKDRARLLAETAAARAGRIALRPRFLRGL
jgi:hypothetical protein